MSEIDIRKTHSFDLAGAQQVADDLARDLSEKFDVDYGWDGDVLLFERTGCHGEIAVDAECVHVRARLGFFLSYLKPAVEREINRYLDEHFVRGKA
ncbi:MAG: polyhydroxyalkanoic acid system family protein [Wenzhouxiangellaceae bacterium]|nr:polyhydroxyalkanoic acid system family protein [Wenzhouxiangellaceae bacterium]MBS3746809.1 polyhydroxyalkanoic acid system family protein [Wenzhouxiangellaceae bacterium]MBS3823328.1 polyhydroxyalkanoic acid system family protein [Wenzhouxiangellaceae bacterium]